jgi:hypothetical protein
MGGNRVYQDGYSFRISTNLPKSSEKTVWQRFSGQVCGLSLGPFKRIDSDAKSYLEVRSCSRLMERAR